MLPINPQTDPIIEILRLAYRRGLALRQEQIEKKKNKPVDSDNLGGVALPTGEQIDPEKESIHEKL